MMRDAFILLTSFRAGSPWAPESRLIAATLPCLLRRPGRAPIRNIRIEAPTTGAANQLVHDLVPFARTDLVPLDDERWEIRVEESTEEELDAVLLAVARWASVCDLKRRHVLVDGKPVELPEPPG